MCDQVLCFSLANGLLCEQRSPHQRLMPDHRERELLRPQSKTNYLTFFVQNLYYSCFYEVYAIACNFVHIQPLLGRNFLVKIYLIIYLIIQPEETPMSRVTIAGLLIPSAKGCPLGTYPTTHQSGCLPQVEGWPVWMGILTRYVTFVILRRLTAVPQPPNFCWHKSNESKSSA